MTGSNTLQDDMWPSTPEPPSRPAESLNRPTFSTDHPEYVIRQGRRDHLCDQVRERGRCEHFFVEEPGGRDLISTLDGRFLTSEAMARKALDAHITRISRGRQTLLR